VKQLLGLFVGAISGVVWEKLSTTAYKNFPSLVPSYITKYGDKTLHIHHWVLYALALIILFTISLKTQRLYHPSILFLIMFLVFAIIYNFLAFPDWYRFVK
jgi:hypothetical protein